MPVKRKSPKVRRTDFPNWQVAMLQYGTVPDELVQTANPFELLNWQNPDRHQKRDIRRVWRVCEAFITPPWIRQHPGTRPHGWWLFDAPEPQRLRLGGIGTPAHEVLAVKQVYDHGLPTVWLTPFLVAYYRGEARDIHGQRIHCAVANKKFCGVALDPDDPPFFESQAAYLQRHGLLQPAELKRLTDDDFQPETIPQQPKE